MADTTTDPERISFTRTTTKKVKAAVTGGRFAGTSGRSVKITTKQRKTYVKKKLATDTSIVEEVVVKKKTAAEKKKESDAKKKQEAEAKKKLAIAAKDAPKNSAGKEQTKTSAQAAAAVRKPVKLVKKDKESAKSEEASKAAKTAKEKPKYKDRFTKMQKASLRRITKQDANEDEYELEGDDKSKLQNNKLSLTIESKHRFSKPSKSVVREMQIPDNITVSELARLMAIKSAVLIKTLMKLGTMVTINETIDQDTAILAVEELGHKATQAVESSVEEQLNVNYSENLVSRAPVVAVMGHVDHGKTSLLDYIRQAKVTASEAGGITQHIGAYKVALENGNMITFLDTPGHAAFTAMRARGALCTDIVILVVAADDGVMPQTVEAIQHAKAANVPVIVAVNKMDKPEADLDKVTNELAKHELIPESWGGDVMFVSVSAKEGTGIDSLLEAINLQAELLELQAADTGPAKGVVLESKLDRGRGPVATVLVKSGCLQPGDILLAGKEYGKIRALIDHKGDKITFAGPSTPVEVIGLSGVPFAGDDVLVASNERIARDIASTREAQQRQAKLSRQQSSKLEGFLERMGASETKDLNIVLKVDVHGSLEAINDALIKLSTDEIKINVISLGVGGINESDVNLAMASNAILVGFNVRADSVAKRTAQHEDLKIYYYSIIYELLDGITAAVKGLVGPKYEDKIIGLADVRDVFRSAKIGAIAGCMVIEGNIKRGAKIRVLRDNVVIYEGELESLRRFKEDAADVRNGMECGIGVKDYNDVKVGDQIEVYEIIEITDA